ncbi:reverse transcriptase [Gossypium australe]|uniref:Reverse transcriptase n=1 Tax=Gossypium australe TaxID=47621 RepID=A0A5B6UY88_9ROSI|nr:reverse transcriptase [Gossypium australe]
MRLTTGGKSLQRNKYVGNRYVEAHRLEFIELKQKDRFMVEYNDEFLWLPPRGHGPNRGGDVGQRQRAQGQGANRADTRQPALVYVARCREDRDAAEAIASTFNVNFVSYFALVDIGSTHSYVSCLLATKLGAELEDTVMYKWYLLEIEGEVFLVDLIELPFDEFDLIF